MLNQDQLTEVAELASSLLPVSDIAIIIGCELTELRELINQPGTDESNAYNRGKLKAKAELQKSQIQLAKQGSQTAASLCQKYIKEQENSELS